jgi:hypothetical protein
VLNTADSIHRTAVQFSETDVATAISSFPAGSSGGPDGIRPQHLRDLILDKLTLAYGAITSATTYLGHNCKGRNPISRGAKRVDKVRR